MFYHSRYLNIGSVNIILFVEDILVYFYETQAEE